MSIDIFNKIINDLRDYLPENVSFNNDFNIFKVLGIESKEVLICRFLGELLNPGGSHEMGSKPLELFMNYVLGIKDETSDSIKNATVDLEEHVERGDGSEGGTRRADIVIHTEKRVYPIEVKINAGDQPAQLYDYYQYFFNNGNGTIYYLTPTGHEPSKDSIGKLVVNKNVKLISFVDVKTKEGKTVGSVEKWIKKVIRDCDSGKLKPIIEQFLKVIEDMKNSDFEAVEWLKAQAGFDDSNGELTKKATFLSLIYRNAEVLLKDIQQKFVINYVEFNDDYIFSYGNDKPKNYKDQVIISIANIKEDRIIAWLSEDDKGLYLVSNTDKIPDQKGWKLDGKRFFWKRICSNKDNVYPSKAIPLSCKIDISDDLSEIMDELRVEDKQA